MTKKTRLDIGGRIRRLRLQQRRTQQDVATACGFTKSMLSKIESNAVTPAVASLVKIADALGATLATLVESEVPARTVETTRDQVESGMVRTDRGYWIYPFATAHTEKRMQPFVIVAKRGQVKEHHLSHTGEEFIYVIEGRMRVQIGSQEYLLEPGGSVYFDATDTHQVIPETATVTYLDIFV